MSKARTVILLCAVERPVKAGAVLDLSRLGDALRSRGAKVVELGVDGAPEVLLDHLEAGAVAVLFRGDSRA